MTFMGHSLARGLKRLVVFTFFMALVVVRAGAEARSAVQLSAEVKAFVKVGDPVVVLNHVRVIDGTGAAARPDQAVVIQNGRIAAIGDSATTKPPTDAKVLDLTGSTVIPGLVGMHNHLHYTADQSAGAPGQLINACLLYTSDAADERSSVDLG